MHIIKITPCSFKIVLSKEDLMRHGVDNILEHADLSGDFFADIIEETNRLYGSPFKEGAIDAEFFEGKDGGGELFICSSKKVHKSTFYLFTTYELENLISLCKRLVTKSHIQNDNRLYFDNDGKYSLLIHCGKRDDTLVSVMKEYGNASEITKFKISVLEEHSLLLISENATRTIAQTFSGSYRKSKDIPL